MSGGHFNYMDSCLKNEIFNYHSEPYNVFEDREFSELVWDVLELIHDYDWYICSDTGREDYIKSKTAFKKKWFSNRGVRVRHTIDTAIQELKTELYETYGLEEASQSDV